MAIQAVNRKTGEVVKWYIFVLWALEWFLHKVVRFILFIEKWAVALVSITFFIGAYVVTRGGVS